MTTVRGRQRLRITRQNLAINPSFEVDIANISGLAGGGNTKTRTTARAKYGTASCRLTATSVSSGHGMKIACANGVTPVNLETWRWSFWVYPSVNVSISPYWETMGSGQYTGGGGGSNQAANANTWTQIFCSAVFNGTNAGGTGSPPRTQYGFGGYHSGSLAIGDTIDFDGFIVERAWPDLWPYFDGSIAPATWDGTAHASSSTLKVV